MSKSTSRGRTSNVHPPPKRVSSFQVQAEKPVSGTNGGKGTQKLASKSGAHQTTQKKTVPKGPNQTAATNKEKPPKPLYDEAMEKKLDDMLEGNMTDLPPLPRSIVRIFISSTFSDMRAERNAISCDVSPKLREFCSGLGLDLQLLDLRWGLTADAQNDHSTEKLCLQEVQNCQDVSLGPNFISILSERYGYRPLPSTLLCPEYEMLRKTASRLSLDVDLLDTWYKRDDNAIPAEYVLQPIRSVFLNFGDVTPGCEELAKRDSDGWQKTFNTLLSVVRQAADSLHKEGKITTEQRHMYYKSVTEFETDKGIYKADKPRSHCLLYHRRLKGLTDKHLDDKDAHRYASIVTEGDKKKLDKEVSELQANAISNIEKSLGQKNCKSFDVPWKNGGIDPVSNPEHDSYMKNFCHQLTEDVKDMIQQAKDERSTHIRQQEYYSGLDETLHHLRFCQMKCESFCGQESILKAVKTHILTSQSRKPLVIWAESGAGKTSVMAMIMNSLHTWIKGNYIGAIRFLGTSPETLDIYDVVFSVCRQLADTIDAILEPVGYKSMDALVEYFPRFLRTVSTTVKKPIIILLDSIDQLSGSNEAYNMSWLPTTLPQNVYLIISTLPKEHNILTNLKKRLPDPSNYLEVPLLSEITGKEITYKYLKLKNRRITEEQVKVILNTFSKAPSPLYLKLLLDESVKWSSFIPTGDLQLAPSIRSAINVLFDRLENKFGAVLVKSALGYITVGLNGISEIELEDALSCDDQVLDDVFQFHDPPVPGFIRIPPVLWARIRYDIKEYLVDRMAQNKTTMFWYHRQFIEAASDRYVQGKAHDRLHLTMLEMYLAVKGFKKDIFLSKRKKEFKDADRQVTPQPTTVNNLRKLKCVPHHLNSVAHAADDLTAKGMVYCSLRFLYTKIAACSVHEVVKDMEGFLEKKDDKDITLVKNFLQSNKNNLKNPLVFAGSILAYLKPEEGSVHLKKLQRDAEDLLASCDKTLLVPVFPCLASRDSDSTSGTLLDDHQVQCFAVLSDSEQIITAGGEGSIRIWLVKCGKLLKSFDVNFTADELHIITNNVVLLVNKEKKMMIAVKSDSGERLFEDIIPSNILSVTVSGDKGTVYVLSQEKTVVLHQLNVKSGTLTRSVALQKMFNFLSLKTILSASERYLAIQAECTPEDYQSIKESWKKSGGFATQAHPYRFAAVDLSQGTGNLLLCLRNLSKIPTLGDLISVYKGNTMLIATRRHGIFWDIPTGKCDQLMSRGKKLTMIYRPDWAGGDNCKGANTCFVQPPSQKFLAVGSEDGYLIIYNFESGLPIGMKAPPTKHSRKVLCAAVTPNAQVVVSACDSGNIKLWNTTTGLEMFSLQVGGRIQILTFTPDSSYLVALMKSDPARMLVFKVQLS